MIYPSAFEIADAVLSGRPVPKPQMAPVKPVVILDGSRVELKLCERCTRNFTRVVGSADRDCGKCVNRSKRQPAIQAPTH